MLLFRCKHGVIVSHSPSRFILRVQFSVVVCRYVREECLEVEVWSCPTSRHPERDGDPCSSEDTLLGTAFLSLQQLLSGDSVR